MAVDFLVQCKVGLNIFPNTSALDNVLNQKIAAVKGYLSSAGVSDIVLNSDLSVGTVVLGVTDLWDLKSGQVKFSPLFYTLASQLVYQSYANINAFKVAYDGNGNLSGIVPLDNNIYQQAGKAVILDNIGNLEKEGFIFSGWNTAADGSGTNYTAGGILDIGAKNVTLYAKWVAA